MIKSRTKIEAVISIAIITLLILPSIIGDVTITDTAITDDTFGTIVSFDNDYIDISNLTISNNASIGNIFLSEPSGSSLGYWNGSSEYITAYPSGKTWIPTEANLQNAIYSCNGTKASIVYSPANRTYTITKTLNVTDNVTLDLQGSILDSSSDINVTLLGKNSNIVNGVIDVTGLSFSKACILLDGQYKYGQSSYSWYTGTNIEKIDMLGDGTGTGILFWVDTNLDKISHILVKDCYTEDFNKAYELNTSQGVNAPSAAWINLNSFIDCDDYDSNYMFYLDRNEAYTEANNAINMNTITDCSWDAPSDNEIGIYTEGNFTIVNGFQVMDGSNEVLVNCSPITAYCHMDITGTGTVEDNGNYNVIIHSTDLKTTIYSNHLLEYKATNEAPEFRITSPDNKNTDFTLADATNTYKFRLDSAFTNLLVNPDAKAVNYQIYGADRIAFTVKASNNYVGINDTTPTADCEIEGTGKITVDWTVDSDSRIKDIISCVSDEQITLFCNHPSVTYYRYYVIENWEDEQGNRVFGGSTNEERIGLIAQDVYSASVEIFGENLANQIISVGNESELWSVRYNVVDMIFNNYIQILSDEISNQQAFLETLGYNPNIDYT